MKTFWEDDVLLAEQQMGNFTPRKNNFSLKDCLILFIFFFNHISSLFTICTHINLLIQNIYLLKGVELLCLTVGQACLNMLALRFPINFSA